MESWRVWLIVVSSRCESKWSKVQGARFEVQGMSAGQGGRSCGVVAQDHYAQDLLEESAGAFEWERVGGDGTENATDCALDGLSIGKRTEADGGRPESFVLTPLTRLQAFVGVAKRRASESEGTAGEVIGFDEGAESGFDSILLCGGIPLR